MTTPSRVLVLVLFWLATGAPVSGWAHQMMMTYVAHDVRVTVGPTNIDISVDLTFNELASLEERRQMDRDQDGRIGTNERALYLAALEPVLSGALGLSVDGRAVEVLTLYNPQLDLLGIDDVGPAHHDLRLSFFARTPTTFSVGQEIVVRDRLWPAAPAIGSSQAAGLQGIQVQLTSRIKTLSEPNAPIADRSIRIKRIQTP